MRNIVYLQNQIKDYEWGDQHTLSELLDVPNPERHNLAELWLGAHAGDSSHVQKGRKLLTLAEMIAKNPAGALGESNALAFHDNLPFLMKIFTVNKPLAVQVCPNPEQAFIGFARENLQDIALNDDRRNYVDGNGRPILLYALKPFWLLNGFRSIEKIKANLAVLIPRFFMERALAHADLKTLFNQLINLNDSERTQLTAKALQNAAKLEDSISRWMHALATVYPADIGILMPALLNLVELEPGKAVYIAPRTPHCFLNGAGLLLSGNSSNVLSLALSAKQADLTELNLVLTFEPQPPDYPAPQTLTALETVYSPPPDVAFKLSIVNMPIKGQIYQQKLALPEILLCASGQLTITRPGHKTGLILKHGQSMFVSHEVGGYSLRGRGLVYKALPA